jgi:hypothetical protein
MKNLLKTIALTLSLVIGVIAVQPTIEANASTKVNKDSESELSQVVLYQDSSKSIVSLVDKKEVEEYKKEISTNPDFKQQEINKANNKVVARSLPEGKIMAQRYMYRSDIQKTVDSYAGTGTYARLMSNPITDATVAGLLKLAGCSNPIVFCATALTWGYGDLMSRQQSWWTDSLLMILKGEIKCVRVTHIRNTVSDYPAAYLIIERL